jgi:glycosyltransferase involved in cell wall biosynthesis
LQRPELSVVVASHARPLRLRWLLNALDQQTLERSLWEVVVCHDSPGSETEQVLAGHPLAVSGMLRFTSLPSGTAPPGANRNAALRLARADTVVFTDDDCRPPAEWLEGVLAAVRTHPNAIIQGPVDGDPDESSMRRSPFPRTQFIDDVPRPWAECCNMVYPRELVERVGGFDELVLTGEDADLCARARAAGAGFFGDSRMRTYHAVDEGTLLDWVRDARRWGDLALLVKRHPDLRSRFPLRYFWRPSHVWMLATLLAWGLTRRRLVWGPLAARWALEHRFHAGTHGRWRRLAALPGWAIIDLAEMAALARGSARHRSILL